MLLASSDCSCRGRGVGWVLHITRGFPVLASLMDDPTPNTSGSWFVLWVRPEVTYDGRFLAHVGARRRAEADFDQAITAHPFLSVLSSRPHPSDDTRIRKTLVATTCVYRPFRISFCRAVFFWIVQAMPLMRD